MSANGERLHVLVSGAGGFIGGKLVRALLDEGHAVRALVRRAPQQLPHGVEPFEGDLSRPESLIGIEERIDAVVHCAGLLGKWGTHESALRAVNVEGSLNLLRRFQGGRLSRFVHLSAGGVTGPLRERAVDESYACRPATAYERSKLCAERAVLELGAELSIPATVVRPTFTYGPGDPHKLPLFRAVQRGRLAFIGDGESVFHPVHCADLVRGLRLALARARTGEVYIVGGERPVTKNEFVQAICDALGVKRPRWRVPRAAAWAAASALEPLGRALGFEPILTRSRVMMMGDNFGYRIDKARRELGYEPRIDLPSGIRQTVEAYRGLGWL
jgi:nucleoside-diphosphate-sugar epimerase